MTTNNFIYLDHAASTPVAPEVLEAMLPYFSEAYGNPSGMHKQARLTNRAMTTARKEVAAVLNCNPKEVIFTSGGSESDNMAIRGVAWAQKLADKGSHIITSPLEHHAVHKTIDQLCAHHGFEQTIVPIDEKGVINIADVEAAIRPDTILISIMAANNEVGSLQPIAEIGEIAAARGIPFHSDTVQAIGAIPLDVAELKIDMLAMSAHKFYGPKGVGILYIREGTPFVPHSTGGSHEDGRRPGTENVPLIVGLATALKLAYADPDSKNAAVARLRDRLIEGVTSSISGVHLTGHPTERLPNHASFVFEGCDATVMLMHLDLVGIGAASGSACATGMPEPSSILLAMDIAPNIALGALRLTLGRRTTEADIDYVLEKLPDIVSTVRGLKQNHQEAA